MDGEKRLSEILANIGRVAVALSGGTDSAYLLYAATKYAQGALALTARTEFTPSGELQRAGRVAAQLGAEHVVVELSLIDDPAIRANGAQRCYHCKRRILTALLDAAAARGFSVLADGSNAEDDPADRPGMQAVEELGIVSPLREAGLGKKEIRARSAKAGLETAAVPSNTCLATRVPTGTEIAPGDLRRIDAAEEALHAMGFECVRARVQGDSARLEVPPEDLQRAFERRQEIVNAAKRAGFERAALDLEGYGR